jgi:hypothetical protein
MREETRNKKSIKRKTFVGIRYSGKREVSDGRNVKSERLGGKN